MKMKENNYSNNTFTTRYSYGNTDSEYVFTCKGRPFAVLVSDNLPTPTSNLLDFDLVKSLGLKVIDLQCRNRKFAFAGNKRRILACPPPCFVASDLNTLLCRQWQDEATDGHQGDDRHS